MHLCCILTADLLKVASSQWQSQNFCKGGITPSAHLVRTSTSGMVNLTLSVEPCRICPAVPRGAAPLDHVNSWCLGKSGESPALSRNGTSPATEKVVGFSPITSPRKSHTLREKRGDDTPHSVFMRAARQQPPVHRNGGFFVGVRAAIGPACGRTLASVLNCLIATFPRRCRDTSTSRA